LKKDQCHAFVYLEGLLNATGNSLLINLISRGRTNSILERGLRPECACTQQITIVIAPLSILSEYECLCKACQAVITNGGLFTDTGVNEQGKNERHIEITSI